MIRILSVGKIKEQAISSLICEYQKRITRFAAFESVELKDETVSYDIARMQEIEAKRILDAIKDNDYVIVCDERGKEFASVDFSSLILSRQEKNVVFVVGSATGLSETIKKRANLLLSLSKMTFPHQLARLFLIEQVYRALTIKHGINYHK